MMAGLGILAGLVAMVWLFLRPYQGILLSFALKPIIDASWSIRPFGISMIMVHGVFFLVACFIFLSKNKLYLQTPKRIKELAVLYLLTHLGLITFGWFYAGGLSSLINFYSKLAFIPISFFIIPTIFNTPKRFKSLLIVLILAGLFPVLASALQGLGIDIGGTVSRQTKGVTRANGFYHDIVTVRMYAFQTLLAIFLYISYYRQSFLKRMGLLNLGAVSLFTLYFTYSKAVIGILLVWGITYLLFNRKAGYAIVMIVFASLVYTFFGDRMTKEVEAVFSKELLYREGKVSDRALFSGRGIIWKDYWGWFNEQPYFMQFFGTGRNLPTAHNEYLRILFLSGYLGLVFFFLTLFAMGQLLLKKIVQKGVSPLILAGIMILEMFVIDCLGIVPAMYPSYLLFALGIIILAVSSNRFDRRFYA